MEEQNLDQFESTQEPVSQWEEAELLQRPKWPKVVGVVSILLASFGLTCGGFGLIMAPLSGSLMSGALNGDPLPYGMEIHALDYAIGGFSLLLSVLLLFAGIAAVTYRPLTRVLHLSYAGVIIPLGIWSYLNQLAKQELNMQWAQEFPNNQMAQSFNGSGAGAAIGQIVGLVIFILLGVGLPLFYLIWFGLIKTKAEQITGGDEGVY